MAEVVKIVVPWHRQNQIEDFLTEWEVFADDPRFILQQDRTRAGCGATKNAGIARAVENGADVVIVLDDDCYPGAQTIDQFIEDHVSALEPQPVTMFETVTSPASRGTPYHCSTVTMPVAASMGFWSGVGDYDAVGQLRYGPEHPMEFHTAPIFGRYFPLCGMNLAFRPKDWQPWATFIDVPRFDDIWMGWLWQKEAWRRGHCFNLNGPIVRHVRQSNVWQNLRDESRWLERNDTLWRDIAQSQHVEYHHLRTLLPV